MGFLLEKSVRQRAREAVMTTGLSPRQQLSRKSRPHESRYDIFLSQAIRDEELVLGIHATLTEDLGLTVFCDWIDAPFSDHAKTTPDNAEFLRDRMLASNGLLFVDSEHASTSTWMSWEIGFFHGAKRRVCVLPLLRDEKDQYRGREFLGLYPHVEEDDRHKLRVPLPASKTSARYRPGTPMAIATWMPLDVWATTDSLPAYCLVD